MTEAELVVALRAGEPPAVERLYALHAADVLRWVIRLGGPSLDAEDVAHEVFLVALRQVRGFRGEAKLSTWLFQITRRVVANARRRATLRRWVGLETSREPTCPAPGQEAEYDARLRRRRVQRALERLSTAHREVLVLSDLEGHAAPEVAAMLDIPPGTVYSRLHHARSRLREALLAEGLGPDGEALGGEIVPLRRAT